MKPGENNTTAQIIIYVILGLLGAFIITFIVWKAIKGKLLKKKAAKAEAIKQQKDLEIFNEYVMSFAEIIFYTEEQLKSFVVSIGDIKMNSIKNGATKLIKKLIERDDFVYTFVNNAQYKTFLDHCETLSITNCNLWNKKIPNTITYFKTQYAAIPQTQRKQEYVELVKKSIRRQFYEEAEKK
ncbi:Uncharacterised protein [Metamycoplasma arthritidis]|uniref:Conserved hypothetical membrane protein n=1 Tax=Metamycoplasma arthritidis (strain 158L3-1) TaxID=243272 RepID=B3PMG4_META1|nr:hypothetical protein [Metamycoplasma arthritidis]ACF07216.1 conserved hypothetical membrane protein [Metamycoplasma arthritidis 158L3-1]VEU78740.1 Uncharacterised protein [Metamycoplasma arthritidis]